VLYVTTRNKNEIETPNHPLCKEHSRDGGLYVPYHLPRLDPDKFEVLKKCSFNECVAQVMNLFFRTKLTGWDVDFLVGRRPARLVNQSHKIVIAEMWHNLSWDFSGIVQKFSDHLRGVESCREEASNWMWIALRIAVLFGIFGELERKGFAGRNLKIDVAVTAGDFSAPVAVWYARKMGLPIANIVCSCNDNSGIWDLLHHGELDTGMNAVETLTPECDIPVPMNLERLIFETAGREETLRFCQCCAENRPYVLTGLPMRRLKAGLHSAVISQNRMESVIRNVYGTRGYILDPYTALAYGGLQDYRASSGESGNALILSEHSAVHYRETVAKALGMTMEELDSKL